MASHRDRVDLAYEKMDGVCKRIEDTTNTRPRTKPEDPRNQSIGNRLCIVVVDKTPVHAELYGAQWEDAVRSEFGANAHIQDSLLIPGAPACGTSRVITVDLPTSARGSYTFLVAAIVVGALAYVRGMAVSSLAGTDHTEMDTWRAALAMAVAAVTPQNVTYA